MSDFPRIFAHRGASSLAPENTIAAFSKADPLAGRLQIPYLLWTGFAAVLNFSIFLLNL